MSDKTECVWTEQGPWVTDCGYSFEVNDGTLLENEMRYCCFCGKPLVEQRTEVLDWDEEEG